MDEFRPQQPIRSEADAEDQAPPDDGLEVNAAHPWVKDKLRIVAKYDPAFCRACSEWGSMHYVDAFAGSGVNAIEEEGGTRLWGSPMIALRSVPAFTLCLFVEENPARAAALDRRTEPFGRRRVVVQGNANGTLLPAMREHLPRKNPLLVLLDPYGMEVDWRLLQELAAFRPGRYKAELLILLPIDGVNRAMYVDAVWTEDRLERFWGDTSWHALWKGSKTGQLNTPNQMRKAGLNLYTSRLREELGYSYAFSKDVREGGHTGRLKYVLVFATDNATGRKIMNDVFDGRERTEQLRLPGFPNLLRRDF
jgi:three-Cys-motif partner protein